jgi:quinol monooxygenase YgiN
MAKFASLVRLDVKAGKEREVEALLQSALSLVSAEAGIRAWFALKIGPRVYGIFDAFDHESDLKAYLAGPVAKVLMQRTSELLSRPPMVEKVEILASLERNTPEFVAVPPSAKHSTPSATEINRPAPEVPKVGSRDAPGG